MRLISYHTHSRCEFIVPQEYDYTFLSENEYVLFLNYKALYICDFKYGNLSASMAMIVYDFFTLQQLQYQT